MDPIEAISVARGPRGGLVLSWDEHFTTAPVDVYTATDPGAFDRACPAVTGARGGAEVAVPASERRWYCRLEPAGGAPLVVGERGVPLAGGVNFRDLGGYRAHAGRRVRWGRLYRSGHMTHLSAPDKRLFAALDIRTVCDFRLAEERAKESTELPGAPTIEVLGIPPGVGDKEYFHRLFATAPGPESVIESMHAMLRSLVRGAAPFFARLFEVLLAGPEGAVLMNCSAGKERTGIGSVLVLSALGVPRQTIMYDFMLSRTHFPAAGEVPRVLEKYGVRRRGEAGKALIMPLLETRASYLEAAFAAIDEDCGSSEAFLARHYGLGSAELSRLRELYTERP